MKYILCLLAVLILSGCIDKRKDMTASELEFHSSVSHKTYRTKTPLYLVSDRSQKDWFIYSPSDSATERAAKKFDGNRIQISNTGFYIYDIIDSCTYIYIEKIIHIYSFEYESDRLYGRVLTGPFSGKLLNVTYLFDLYDGQLTIPRNPKTEYIEEINSEESRRMETSVSSTSSQVGTECGTKGKGSEHQAQCK